MALRYERLTGEPDALKGASPVRRGAAGNLHRGPWCPSRDATTTGKAPAAYPTIKLPAEALVSLLNRDSGNKVCRASGPRLWGIIQRCQPPGYPRHLFGVEAVGPLASARRLRPHARRLIHPPSPVSCAAPWSGPSRSARRCEGYRGVTLHDDLWRGAVLEGVDDQ